jgi:hypothetical protein
MKEAYYFSHDSNARNDPKIIKLRIKLGWQGYGIFWALIEMLRDQNNYAMQVDSESIAYALHTDCDLVRAVIFDFDLFKLDGDFFYSESLCERMKIRQDKSEKSRNAANKRWSKENASAMHPHSESNASAMQLKEKKGKEILKEKEIEKEIEKENVVYDFAFAYEQFKKQSIKGKPFFDKMKEVHSLDDQQVEKLFRNWENLSDRKEFDSLRHLEGSFNLFCANKSFLVKKEASKSQEAKKSTQVENVFTRIKKQLEKEENEKRDN